MDTSTSERCPGTDRWGSWPSPFGLSLGILAALAAQVGLVCYHYARLRWGATKRVQLQPRPYEFWEGVTSHLGNPGGIVMMVMYLCASWMFDVMPCSYYHFEGGVRWWMVFAQVAPHQRGSGVKGWVGAFSGGERDATHACLTGALPPAIVADN